MIKIDMEMPRTCDKCILAKEITSKYFGCPVIEKAIPTGHKSQNCPLHPLDDAIRVGDEVITSYGACAVVLGIDSYADSLFTVCSDGSCGAHDTQHFTKTGRHFDEVETMLKKMRGEEV